MTPEQLEEIPGIGPESVEQLRDAVNAYYSQFETDNAEPAQEAEPAASVEEPAERGEADAGAREAEPGADLRAEGAVATAETPSEPEVPEELLEPGPEPVEARRKPRSSLVRWKTRVPPLTTILKERAPRRKVAANSGVSAARSGLLCL